jgi:2'-5' RNA ligase
MTRYTIATLVPEPYASQLGAMRKEYDVFTRQWLPPHVTIIPPFELDLSRDEIATLREFPVNVSATFDGWSDFRRSTTSVLVLMLRDHKFRDLLENILRTLPKLEPFRPQEFEGHVTVVSRIPNERFDEVATVVTKDAVEGSFTVNKLMLYHWDDVVRQWISLTM